MAVAGRDVHSVNTAAGLYSRCDQPAEAKRLYLRALEIEPDNAQLLYNLGTVQRFLGELEEAALSFDSAFRLNPDGHSALCISAQVKTQTLDNNHIADIEAFLKRQNVEVTAQVQLCYALAKEHEDLAQWDQSFAALQRGATLKRQHMRYEVSHDEQIMSAIAQHYQQLPTPANANQATVPIFILGLPRTGSTLIESILGSHKDIVPGGEMPDFSKQLDQQIDGIVPQGNTPTITERIAASASADFELLGKCYLNAVRGKVNDAQYFTDKLPFNFLYCGLIMQALPNARIIHTRRNPMDTCYAIYKTLFRHAYPYSYDLDDLAEYFIAYWKLMEHWRTLMPTKILDVDYESMVADTQAQAQRMVDFCGLAWDPACLDYQHQKKSVTTASAAQVRQPVYSSSIEKWRHVEKHFKGLEKRLREAGILSPLSDICWRQESVNQPLIFL